MALKNKYDVFYWIKNVIDSCKTVEQSLEPITNLINNFQDLYEDGYLVSELLEHSHNKYYELFEKK